MNQIINDKRYQQYLYEFNVTRNYYYCHDLLESLWLETNREYESLKYLIQLAIMQYKKETGNVGGFKKLLANIVNRFDINEQELIQLGIDTKELFLQIQHVFKHQDNAFYQFMLITN